MDFCFEKWTSGFQIPLAYFVTFFPHMSMNLSHILKNDCFIFYSYLFSMCLSEVSTLQFLSREIRQLRRAFLRFHVQFNQVRKVKFNFTWV